MNDDDLLKHFAQKRQSQLTSEQAINHIYRVEYTQRLQPYRDNFGHHIQRIDDHINLLASRFPEVRQLFVNSYALLHFGYKSPAEASNKTEGRTITVDLHGQIRASTSGDRVVIEEKVTWLNAQERDSYEGYDHHLIPPNQNHYSLKSIDLNDSDKHSEQFRRLVVEAHIVSFNQVKELSEGTRLADLVLDLLRTHDPGVYSK